MRRRIQLWSVVNDMDKKTLTFPLDRIADKNERLAAVEALNRILSDIKGDVFIGSCSCIYVPNVTHTECELLWDDLNPDIIFETQYNRVRMLLSNSECIGKTLYISTVGYNAYEISIK